MSRKKLQQTTSEVPCALRNYLKKQRAKLGGHRLSEQDRELVFLNFIAYEMNSSPDIQNDHLECPMYYCRQPAFTDMRSFLNHVAKCEWLSDAAYDCPKHGCEYFSLHDKNPRLKRAYDFFKSFGRINRRDHSGNGISQTIPRGTQEELEGDFIYPNKYNLYERHQTPGTEINVMRNLAGDDTERERSRDFKKHVDWVPPRLDGISVTYPNKHDFYVRYEMPGTEFDSLSKHELEDTRRKIPSGFMTGFASDTLMLDGNPLCEMRLSTQTTGLFEMASPEPMDKSAHLIDTTESVGVSQDYAPPQAGTSMRQDSTNESRPISAVSPSQPARNSHLWDSSTQFPLDLNDTARSGHRSFRKSATSCMCDKPGTSIDQQTLVDLNKSLPQTPGAIEQFWPSEKRLERVYTPCERDTMCEESLQTPSASDGTVMTQASLPNSTDRPDCQTLNTQQYVETLYQLMCMFDKRWRGYLRKWPGLSNLSGGARFDPSFPTTLHGLKQCFRGQFPSKIRDIFPLMHLAYACAYICHRRDDLYDWNGFYENVLQWGTLISDKRDQYRFVRIADMLWSPPPTPLERETHLQSTDLDQPQSLGQAKLLRLYIPEAMATSSQHSSLIAMAGDTVSANVHQNLIDGLVMGTCARALDDFAYSHILERLHTITPESLDFSPAVSKELVVERVFNILLQHFKYNTFHPIIMKTRTAWEIGKLRDVREVEVCLLAEPRRDCLSGQYYSSYRKAVTFLCYHVVGLQDPSWQNRYATQVDQIEAIWFESERGQQQLVFEQSTLSDCCDPIQPPSMHDKTFFISDTSDESPSSYLTAASPSTPGQSTLWTVSSDPSPTSSPPSSLSSPSEMGLSVKAAAPNEMRCAECNVSFSSKSNHQRHLRDKHHIGNPLICSVDGCDEEFWRANKLRTHKSRAHNINDAVTRQSGKRQRTSSEEKARLPVNNLLT